VRRRVHHLRELCCDASVANLLREDTPAYRETLLETARRFLATHGEPGLGLLGLFENANCLTIRLRWLEKPTWRHRNMKNLIVAVIVGFVAACALPMARAQPVPAARDNTTVSRISGAEATAEMRDLQVQMRVLQEQMQQLRTRMGELRGQTPTLQHETAIAIKDGRVTRAPSALPRDEGTKAIAGATNNRKSAVLGQWELKYRVGDQYGTARLTLSQNAQGAVDANWISDGIQSAVSNVKVDGDKVTLSRTTTIQGSTCESTFQGSVKDVVLAGTMKDQMGDVSVIGTRIGARTEPSPAMIPIKL
jgi:hypothetical protein